MRTSSRWLVLVSLLAVLAAVPCARAQGFDDEDADGVADEMDSCPETPAADIVKADGCSVCACEAATHRYDHFRCVVTAARALRDEGRLTRRQYRDALRHARLSTCGDPTRTRCCIWRDVEDDEGRCRLVVVDRCDEEMLHADLVDDLDLGSCLPNPCTLE